MKTFVMTAFAAVLFSTAASANSVTIQCSDDIERGTLKLTNPPTMNCDDFNLVKRYVGSGVTVGPDSKVNELVSAIESIQPAPTAKPVKEVSTEPLGEEFRGIKRHEHWFSAKGDTTTKCSTQENKWINFRFNEDGGVTIKR
tara:strand:+ start:1559 stop:1984 length:426 start_codon:yes stop_codon:yes gene_type:complete